MKPQETDTVSPLLKQGIEEILEYDRVINTPDAVLPLADPARAIFKILQAISDQDRYLLSDMLIHVCELVCEEYFFEPEEVAQKIADVLSEANEEVDGELSKIEALLGGKRRASKL